MTNREYIESLTNEQIAEFLAERMEIISDCDCCPIKNYCVKDFSLILCYRMWLKWLGDEYEELEKKNIKLLDSISRRKIKGKETADKIFNDIFALINNAKDKSSKIFGNSSDYGKGYKNSVSHFNEQILELAKQYGVEVEE